MKFLDVKIDNVTKNQALNKVAQFLQSKKQHMIFTPNPEMIVDAQRDEYFKEVLNEGDLNICDGFGLKVFSGFRLERISGVDFMQDILKLAEEKNQSVYFLGSGDDQTIQNLKFKIQKQYPMLQIAGAHPGHELRIKNYESRKILDVDKQMNNDLIADIVMTKPDILFVAFGHGKQEKWMYEYVKDIPRVKIAMGVGGSFDFLSGKIKRAPKWMRVIGMEWLYRLVREPRRFRRIWKATVVFSFYCVKRMFR